MVAAIIFDGLVLIIFSICWIVFGITIVDMIKSTIDLNNTIKNRTVRNIVQVIMIVFWPIAGVGLLVGMFLYLMLISAIGVIPEWFKKNFE